MGRWSLALGALLAIVPSEAFVPLGWTTVSSTRLHVGMPGASYMDSLSRNNNVVPPSGGNDSNNNKDEDEKEEDKEVEELLDETDEAVQQALEFFNQNVKDETVVENELTLAERISSTTAATAFGSSETFVTARENIKEAKERMQHHIMESNEEIEKAVEQIAAMKAETDAEAKKLEEELELKLKDTQVMINEEVVKMGLLLQTEIDLEKTREAQILDLIDSLKDSIVVKKKDLTYFENVADEMAELKKKLKPGPGLDQINELLGHKLRAARIEKGLLDTLHRCQDELNSLLEEARDRATRMRNAKEGLISPEAKAKANAAYEWTDIEAMDYLLQEAADNVVQSEARLQKLRKQINNAVQDSRSRGEDREGAFAKALKKVSDFWGKLSHSDNDDESSSAGL